MSDVPVGFRFTANGIDDTISRIKQLHEELNRGTITTQEYRSEMREVTTNTKAATQEFNQIKGAVYAANPTLLEFTKTMSGFSQVAQTSLGITTALNIAMLSTSQSSNTLQDLKTRYADVTLEVDKLTKAFGENDVRTQAAKTLQQELANQMGSEQQKVLLQTIGNWITFGSSMVLAVNQVVNLVAFLKTLNATMNPLLAENFAIGLAGVGSAAFMIAAGAGIAFLGIEAVMTALRLLSPDINANLNTIAEDIKNTFGVDNLTAQLLAPFYAFLGGLAEIGNGVENFFIYLYNGIITNFVNPLISAWDTTIGKITGSIGTLSPENYINQSKNDILKELGLTTSTNSSGLPQNPTASSTNSFLLTGQMKESVDTQKQQLDTNRINNILLTGISSDSSSQTAILNMINGSSQLQAQIAAQQLDATNTQKANIEALKASIIDNTNKIVELQKLPQTKLVSTHSDPDTGQAYYDAIAPTDAANQIQQLQQQNAQAAQIIAGASSTIGGLDNMVVGLGPILQNLGLDASTGIGSVIAGALGGAAGIGGAGISQGEIQQFVKTHDYGVFTAAAMRDNGSSPVPTQQGQIDALLKSWQTMGLKGYTATDAAKALGYTSSGSNGSANIGSGAFLGLPGQYGNPIAAAVGFEGMVSGPTHFLAGESGPEFVSISPSGKSSSNTTIIVNTNFEGSLLAEHDFERKFQQVLKETLKRSGFT